MKTDETRNLTNQGCSIQVVPVMWEPEGNEGDGWDKGDMVGFRSLRLDHKLSHPSFHGCVPH